MFVWPEQELLGFYGCRAGRLAVAVVDKKLRLFGKVERASETYGRGLGFEMNRGTQRISSSGVPTILLASEGLPQESAAVGLRVVF